MNILIPLGGKGERFEKKNYTLPKSLINIFGKPIIFYLLDSLNLNNIDLVYIPYNIEYSKFNIENKIQKRYPKTKFKFLKLEIQTRGAVETINIALKKYNLGNQPILCLDGDNFYEIDIIKLWNGKNIIFTFEDLGNQPIYSYLNIANKKVINIIEKEKISNYACTGAYGFESSNKLLEYTQFVIDNDIKIKNEFYTSVVIKEMIKNNIVFNNININKSNWCCLGTPIQLRHFYNSFPKTSCLNSNIKIEPKKICFFLNEETLPIYTKNKKFIEYLKKFGNTITIHSNLGKEKINCKEVYSTKPKSDIYINNLGKIDLEKYLGFYMDSIDPRTFNNLEYNILETITKSSPKKLDEEIYYYKNIPIEIKDLFGLFIDYDINGKWYKMEKINGLTVTTLYLYELLTIENLKHIMNSINRIHKVQQEDINNINIYQNYAKKLKSRYLNYNYSKFPNSEKVFKDLHFELLEYEKLNLGKKCIIHGDPVMTNIIINNYDKIKLIDMRGKQGEELSIFGDWLYDWAKLYQSILGYDKILQDKEINSDYEKKMKKTFEEYFIELFSKDDLKNVKMITKSLLFSLIPLHDNEKCFRYYELIL
jgi:NDP-sugar pyrophosphorylase family protein